MPRSPKEIRKFGGKEFKSQTFVSSKTDLAQRKKDIIAHYKVGIPNIKLKFRSIKNKHGEYNIYVRDVEFPESMGLKK